MAPYSYPTPNSELLSTLGLEKHIEGGYFKQTHICEEQIPSPLANGEPRPLSTTIYYLLTADEPRGYFHRNKSHTMHMLNQGRAKYTLIDPTAATLKVEQAVMGVDSRQGETRQLFVGGDVWKASEIPTADLQYAEANGKSGEESVGCLISEVVFPGFVWQDHDWMTMEQLKDIFKGVPDASEKIALYTGRIRPEP